MDDLTKIRGIGKAAAKRLTAAGYGSYAALAAATDAAALAKLQKAGFATVDINAWVVAADALIAAETNSEGSKDGQSDPAGAPAQADAGASPSGEAAGLAASDAPADSEVPQGTISLPGRSGWLELENMSRADAEQRFPLTLQALQAWMETAGGAAKLQAGPVLRITARRDGFRRAGISHPRQPTEYQAERFTPAEVENLLAEPSLTVELIGRSAR